MSDWCPLELRSLRSGEEERQEPEYIREESCEKCHANSKEEMTTHVQMGDKNNELLEDHRRWHIQMGF